MIISAKEALELTSDCERLNVEQSLAVVEFIIKHKCKLSSKNCIVNTIDFIYPDKVALYLRKKGYKVYNDQECDAMFISWNI